MRTLYLIPCFLLFAALTSVYGAETETCAAPQIRVQVLDDCNLAVTVNYAAMYRQRTEREHGSKLRALARSIIPVKTWRKQFLFDFALTAVIAAHRPEAVAKLQDYAAWKLSAIPGPRPSPAAPSIKEGGYWQNAVGLARLPDFTAAAAAETPPVRDIITKNAEVNHYVFLTLAAPLTPHITYVLTLPTGESVNFVFAGEENISPLFKLNQLGFAASAGRKYIYLGAWRGDAGALSLQRYAGTPFQLVNAASGRTAFSGTVTLSAADKSAANGALFSGMEMAELDISACTAPGAYYCVVAGAGRSPTFRIDDAVLGESFFIHARGLYHQRCTLAKTAPFTHWNCGACHREVIRGNFPPNDRHYSLPKKDASGKVTRDYGFFNKDGVPVRVEHFKLIAANVPLVPEKIALTGGWHDAADFDRRPYHFGAVNDLLAVYLMRPEVFCDGQLNIPESGNGIPDIIDEAEWGVRVWREAQQRDGGVGTWIEASRHPQEHDPAKDPLPYYLSLATRESSLEYAAHAAMLALALRQAGQIARSDLYTRSAASAWAFATAYTPAPVRHYKYPDGKKTTTVFYRENSRLPAELLFKAGLDLFLLTRDEKYLHKVAARYRDIESALKDIEWRFSPFLWVELEVFAAEFALERNLTAWRDKFRERVRSTADKLCKMLDENYSCRIPWYAPDNGFVSHMSWGNALPLRRARWFVAAHRLTGDSRYRDAALLCNDWHNGGNPTGQTLTSGLGYNYPVRFLNLVSYCTNSREFVPGITPYRHTFGITPEVANMVHGLFVPPRLDCAFTGRQICLLPAGLRKKIGITAKNGAKEPDAQATHAALNTYWPIWRRIVNLEGWSVAASEYTVWETISPAAAVTGYLLPKNWTPDTALLHRMPAAAVEDLPGYWALP